MREHSTLQLVLIPIQIAAMNGWISEVHHVTFEIIYYKKITF
jgi:hypothetical protein